MAIKLSILPHQTECIRASIKVFDGVDIRTSTDIYANPIFDVFDEKLKLNIDKIQSGEDDFNAIPKTWRTKVNDGTFGFDVRMETGTGKTYCYTRLMYELNKRCGFNKFVLFVPTTPIKEGTRSFIEADYSIKHFADLYPGKSISLSVLDPQKKKKGRKMFPQAVADYARGNRLEKNRIYTLLMGSGMLLSKATMDNEYDQTLLGNYSNPYDTIASTNPIVIIDEPHKFKRDNKAYTTIIERLNPLCVIRFGATFPEGVNGGVKDYNNLIFNLGSCEAFNENLVKGVATQFINDPEKEEVKIKVMDIIKSPKSCKIRNEKEGKTYTLSVGDSLSIVDKDFAGIDIQNIGNTDNEFIKTGITLSNGQVLAKTDILFAGIYGMSYQELMMKQAIKNHIEQEKENFFKSSKIKTLSLFFIDSVSSYRGEEGDGYLRLQFEEMLKEALEKEIENYEGKNNPTYQDYVSFLKASIKNIKETNGGYFAEDNAKSDEEIQKEVDQILRDKQKLLSFKDRDGNWITRRFVFSKWTLREGWDNPNVFQIVKLRSSGSEISKLQEVGRGLRLPVDEYGNRISDEQFYLRYLIDLSEKDFAHKLIAEINSEFDVSQKSIKPLISKVAKERGIDDAVLLGGLMFNGFVDTEGMIIQEKAEELYEAYPEFRVGLQQNKVIDKTASKKETVAIRKDKFKDIKKLWTEINKKYFVKLDEVPEEHLYEAILDILEKDIYEEMIARVTEEKTVGTGNGVELRESGDGYYVIDGSLSYSDFLKQLNRATSLPMSLVHKAFCEYDKKKKINDTFFNKKTLSNFITEFQAWFVKEFVQRFSYKALSVDVKETSLTDMNGEVRDHIIQGNIGIHYDSNLSVPEKFLYDAVVFDSPKEKESIINSDIDEVVVFGKIPRRSIQVPLFFGGTTSPDFMYLLKKDGKHELNFIVETKDIENESSLRYEEKLRIESARKFFETLKIDGVNVRFEKQLKNDDIESLIRKILLAEKHGV